MIPEDYEATRDFKIFIRIFHFFDCFNQTSITTVRLQTRYFDSVKRILKQIHCRMRLNKKSQKRQATGFDPLCHIYMYVYTYT